MVETQRLEIRQLQHQNSNALIRQQRWAAKHLLPVEVVDSLHSSWQESTDPVDFQTLLSTLQTTSVSSEEDVQKMWNSLMDSLVCRENRSWRDCRKPQGVVYSGRTHDINLVLLSGQSLAMEYLDVPIELKEKISSDAARRDVVLQILDRIACCAKAQPERQTFWGIGMDSKSYVVVKCMRDLQYSVSQLFEIDSIAAFKSLKRLLNCHFEYIPVTLPTISGQQVTTRLGESSTGAVFAVDDSTVVKVSTTGGAALMRNELQMLNIVAKNTSVAVTPLPPENQHVENPGSDFVLAFTMPRCRPLCLSSDDEIFSMLISIFWRLAVVHRCGIVHNDIKPSNILERTVDAQVEYLLCDFGHAYDYQKNTRDERGATDAFSSIPGVFLECTDSVTARDMECLYWTVLYLWTENHGLAGADRESARDVIVKLNGNLINPKQQLVEVENANLKSFLTCAHLPSVESVQSGGEAGASGITLDSCPSDVSTFLFSKTTPTS